MNNKKNIIDDWTFQTSIERLSDCHVLRNFKFVVRCPRNSISCHCVRIFKLGNPFTLIRRYVHDMLFLTSCTNIKCCSKVCSQEIRQATPARLKIGNWYCLLAWTSWCLKSSATYLTDSSRSYSGKYQSHIKNCITSPLWGQTTGYWWIVIIKGL